MNGPQIRRLPDGRRLHLCHGPIDIVAETFGPPAAREAAERALALAFPGILEGLVAELPRLRRPVTGLAHPPRCRSPVARRMVEAVWPHRTLFVTPMAAVAGAVADHLLAAMAAVPGLAKAYVNNGGDIAFLLTPGTSLCCLAVGRLRRAEADLLAEIAAEDPVRGVATSGRGGRSFTLGIADAVTVLAETAAAADAAATLIADAVDLEHPAIRRRPACELDPDSDLGELPVTVEVGALEPEAVAAALDAGAACARRMLEEGTIVAAALRLRGECRVVGGVPHGGFVTRA